MKLFRLILLTVFTVCISATLTLAQNKKVAKMQAPMEYAHYEKTWEKKEKKALKETLSYLKKKEAASKKGKGPSKKITKLRAQVAELSARKEGSND